MKNLLGKRARGQGMAEFALVLPVIIFTILGIVEIGRALFTYAMVADAHRDALRQAEILGYDGDTPPFLDCAEITRRAEDAWFAEPTVTISYEKGSSNTTYTCAEVNANENLLETGDIMRVKSDAAVKFLFFPFADLNLHFDGERTLVKALWIGDTGAGDADSDYDGLLDDWEITYWGNITSYSATDDPDGDGCNNGCEESLGTNPTVIDVVVTDNDGDGMDDNWETAHFGSPAAGLPNDDPDLDGITNLEEFQNGTDPNNNNFDTDGDGLLDAWELTYWSDLSENASGDPDGDGVTNEEEETGGTDPTINNFDTDSDGLTDSWEIGYWGSINVYTGSDDPDSDGIPNAAEEAIGSDPTVSALDTDGDLLGDDWENFYFGNLNENGSGDPDGDGVTNEEEETGGTNPNIHNNDTDQDGLWDDWENTYFGHLSQVPSGDPDNDSCDNACEQTRGTDPTFDDTDSDGDGLPDVWENSEFGDLDEVASGDPDGDGVTNLEEYQGGTDPNIDNDDLDQDNLSDTWEMINFGNLDQNGISDPDNDGYDNEWEETNGTNPNIDNDDLDQDNLSDAWEMTYFGDYDEIGSGDPDGDGADNETEETLGTDPTVAPTSTVSGRLHRDNFQNCSWSGFGTYSGDPVALSGSNNYNDTTDGSGNYSMSNVVGGTYTFTFPGSQGFTRSETAQINGGTCINLSRGVSSINVTIQSGTDVTIDIGYD